MGQRRWLLSGRLRAHRGQRPSGFGAIAALLCPSSLCPGAAGEPGRTALGLPAVKAETGRAYDPDPCASGIDPAAGSTDTVTPSLCHRYHGVRGPNVAFRAALTVSVPPCQWPVSVWSGRWADPPRMTGLRRRTDLRCNRAFLGVLVSLLKFPKPFSFHSLRRVGFRFCK